MSSDDRRNPRCEPFIRGDHLDLVILDDTIVRTSNWFRWFNDPETTRFMQHGIWPNTLEDQIAFLKSGITGNRTRLQLGVVPKGTEVVAGMVSLYPIDHLHRKAEINLIIGEKEYRCLRYSIEATGRMIDHAFDKLNLRRIFGGSLSLDWTILLSRTFNFKDEGTFREDVYKNGGYHNVYNIGLLKSEYTPVRYDKL